MSKLTDDLEKDINEWGLQDAEFNEQLNSLQNLIRDWPSYSGNVQEEFNRLTGLQKEDYYFIFLCATLQGMRQYLVTDFKERLSDQEAAKLTKGNKKESSSRGNARLYQSIDKIRLNPVPFDAISGGKELKAGVSGYNHRFVCPGHDPILGYLFGTINIMTGTITVIKGLKPTGDLLDFGLKNYYVKTEILNTFIKNDKEVPIFRDFLEEEVGPFSELLDAVAKRIKKDKKEGLQALCEALLKEYEHLKSDKISSQSVPIPCIGMISPNLASEFSKAGLDFENLETIGKQYTYSYIINTIISMLYYALHKTTDGYEDKHKVRIQKILNVANTIATSSNLVYCLVTSIFNENNFRKFDVGGFVYTFHQLIQSADFINLMEEKYIIESMKNKINII